MDAVLHDLHFRIKSFSDKSLVPLHPLLFTDFRIAPLVHAPDMDAVFLHQFFQHIDDHHFKAVYSQSKGLYHQYISELIHYNARQEIRLPKDHAAA